MSILPITTLPNPILKQETVEVSVFNDKLVKTINDMYETMHNAQGVGLAAPQVGILEKFFIVEYETFKKTFINPRIISLSGSAVMEEGCLSIPGIQVDVERATKIKVEAQDEYGKQFSLTAHDFIAHNSTRKRSSIYRLVTDNKEYPFNILND